MSEEKVTKTKKLKEEVNELNEKKVIKKTTRKSKKVLLKEEDQKRYKILSKIIKILAKIAKVVLMICVPFLFLAMILIPIIFKNIEIEANVIKYHDSSIIIGNDNITLNVADEDEVIKIDENISTDILDFISQNSKTSIIIFIELSLLLIAIIVIIEIYIFQYLEKIFINIVNEKTPFIEENTQYILKIAILLSSIKFIDICLSFIDLTILQVNTISILEILIVYVLYFIFKYATELQTHSKSQISE